MKIISKLSIPLGISIVFTILFYEQSPGLNTLLFTILSVAIIQLLYPSVGIRRKLIAFAAPLYTSILLCLYLQDFTFLLWLGSYTIMWLLVAIKMELIIAPIYSMSSIFIAPFKLLGELFERQNNNSAFKLGNLIIPGLIGLVFLLLYSSSNLLLSDYLTNLKFTIKQPEIIICIIFAFLWHLGLVMVQNNKYLNGFQNIANHIEESTDKNPNTNQYKQALYSFCLASIILTVLNITDVAVLCTGKLPEGITYSQYVHNGFNSLLFAMILAIIMVLYFLKGQLNYHINSKQLSIAVYIWISQNFILCLTTFVKNSMYVSTYGLTYQRITVYLFLIIVSLALILLIYKVNSLYSTWAFTKHFINFSYLIIILAFTIPFDIVITHYNLDSAKEKDIYYVIHRRGADFKKVKAFIDDNPEEYGKWKETIDDKIKRKRIMANRHGWQSWNYYLSRYIE